MECTCLTFHGCWFEGNKSGWQASEGNGIEALKCGRMEVLSCHFEDASTGVSGADHRTPPFVRLEKCPSAIVEGCWFQGGASETTQRPKPHRAVRFVESAASRLSNNTAENMQTEFALLDDLSAKCVEMGNNYLDNAWAGVPTISGRVFNLSGGGVGLYSYASTSARPNATAVKAGTPIWVEEPGSGSTLQVSDGSS